MRLSQKLYCTKSFLELVFTLALEPSSKTFARRVRLLLLKHFVTVNAPAPFILPNKATVMKILMKCADTFSHVVHDGLKRLAASRDFRAVSIDGTYKFLMSVQGQEPHGRRRGTSSSKDEIHVVVTARSMSGCIFLAEAMFSEDVGEITQKLRAISGLKEQLEFVHVDRPFDWDKSSVFKAFPHLVAIGGDALHLVFEASGCFGESMKPGIVVDLKKIQHKWAAGGSTKWLLSPFFRSADGLPRALSCYERACASASNLSKATAKKLLEAVNPDVPYHSRAQYLKYLAASLVSHPQVMRRKSADGKKHCVKWFVARWIYGTSSTWRMQQDSELKPTLQGKSWLQEPLATRVPTLISKGWSGTCVVDPSLQRWQRCAFG